MEDLQLCVYGKEGDEAYGGPCRVASACENCTVPQTVPFWFHSSAKHFTTSQRFVSMLLHTKLALSSARAQQSSAVQFFPFPRSIFVLIQIYGPPSCLWFVLEVCLKLRLKLCLPARNACVHDVFEKQMGWNRPSRSWSLTTCLAEVPPCFGWWQRSNADAFLSCYAKVPAAHVMSCHVLPRLFEPTCEFFRRYDRCLCPRNKRYSKRSRNFTIRKMRNETWDFNTAEGKLFAARDERDACTLRFTLQVVAWVCYHTRSGEERHNKVELIELMTGSLGFR